MPHGGVAWSAVANFANTYPGQADGVVADAYAGMGNDVGGQSVIVHGPTATIAYYILMENSGYVLEETNDKIQLES